MTGSAPYEITFNVNSLCVVIKFPSCASKVDAGKMSQSTVLPYLGRANAESS